MSETTLSSTTPRLPRHVAIIMDGNGRWASARGLPRTAGHKAGIDAVRRAMDAAEEFGVQILTLYSFSTENWQRPAEEVGALMGLLRFYIKSELAEFHRRGVRLRVIGDRAALPDDIQTLLADAEKLTTNNTAFTLQLALSYGGRQEIVAAARHLAAEAAAGRLDPDAIDDTVFSSALYTGGTPDPDLVIRTSGELRLSNFLLWQSAYAEFYFTPVLWPDFDRAIFAEALAAYGQRERRYGLAHG